MVLAGDLNLHFDKKLEAKGGKPTFKKKSIAMLIEIFEEFDLCDIWRERNPNNKSYTFH